MSEYVEEPVDVEEEPIVTEEVPVEETPVEEASVEEAPVEDAPVEDAPVEDAPVEDTPVEDTPVEDAPVEDAPVEEAPVEDAPVEEPAPVSTQEVVQNVQEMLTTEPAVSSDSASLEERVKVLEERLESLINIFGESSRKASKWRRTLDKI